MTTTSTTFYTHREELWNTWSHAAGLALGLTAIVLYLVLYLERCDPLATAAVSLYFVGMMASYATSTAYHALRPGSVGKAVLRKFDHAAIFWHIAGSYSPITLIALVHEGYWGWGLFAFIWVAALAGTIVVARKLSDHSNIETLAFVVMGLSVLVAFGPLIRAASLATVLWIAAEGVAYIAGALFYTLHHRRYMHTVFHFFVLIGSLCHIMAVWTMLENMA